MYVGDWLKGYQQGQGLWINTRGESYNGEWRCGKAEGIGSLIIKSTHNSKSGRKYKGAFFSNKQHGFGRESFVNGDSYEGMYKDDAPTGKGTYLWANGSAY
jgi:1-phosphatidylinositol-4-phosphate 5-kinase